jgi:signal transduction histidine kinase/ligand-binding sensor domain-containing protein/CheY-like chemotaxis protein
MFRILSLLVALVAFAIPGTAQEYNVSRHISSSNGLSNDFVLSLAIDGQGYVWVATEAGVNRIAGNICQPFPSSEKLREQNITSLLWHDPTQQMLIGTERGLYVYNEQDGSTRILTGKEGLIKSSINDIAYGSDGVWLVYGNGQLQKLDCKTLEPKTLELGRHHAGRFVLDDGNGHLYIGHTQHGMTVVNLSNGTLQNYQQHLGDVNSLPGNNVRCIYQDRQQRIWVGTDTGLALFDPVTGSFTNVTRQRDDYDDNVYDIVQLNDGLLWVATDIGGIRVLDPNSRELHYLETSIKLSSRNTRSVIQDAFGNIWVGNHSTGVDFISAQKSDFHQLDYKDSNNKFYPIYALTQDDGNGFWLAGERELVFWKDGRLAERWTSQNKIRREFFFPRCLMRDSKGNVWIGIDDQGVYCFNKETTKISQIPIPSENSDIHSFAEDSNGRIWIGGEFGVYIFDHGELAIEDTISQILQAPATFILQTAPHQMFIATVGDGLYSFNLQNRKWRHLNVQDGLLSSKIRQVIRSMKGGLWMATDGGLVYLENPIALTGLKCYDRQQGLNDNHILALQEDAEGKVWMSTYSGISCFDESTGKCYNYNLQDTGQSGGFAYGAAITDQDGNIYFGSASGVCYFNPKELDEQSRVSNVQIVRCEAYDPVGNNTEILELIPNAQGHVNTTYKQNTLRLSFTVRNYAQTERVEYSYMMKGMDSKWYEIGDDYDVVFRGLRPGNYTFILKAKLRNQDWKDADETSLKIFIAPPFWRTWWAYLAYAIILGLLGWYYMRSYKRKLSLRNTLELERRESLQKQEMNEERLRFFTNITHELRTPLTLILGPLDDLMDDKQLSAQNHRRVSMISKSAERLRCLINEILEFRKTETQNRRLTVARGDIGKFVSEICLNYKELYRNPRVQFSYEIAENLPDIWFDSEIVTTILNNFLSNAIKYTEEGSITTTVKTDDAGHIAISVADTGYGISPDALPHVFERYYQVKGSHQASGTGIGLALVKSLADLHEAKVSVKSVEKSKSDESDSDRGQGSCFTLSLDINNSYPNALHKEDVENVKEVQAGNEELKDEDGAESIEESHPLLLIVEDNADIRTYIADSFCEDFRIIQAENGKDGVEMALEQIPDIIVSDIMMPKLNGIQLTRQLKADIRTSHVPIILLTAKSTDEDKEEGYDSGADSYLTKPFTAKLLSSRIQNLLTSRRRLAEYITRHPGTTEDVPSVSSTPQLGRLDKEFLDKLNGIIRDNIMSQDIDLPFVTDKMAMSHSSFYRKVKALTGLTAKEYIRKICLQHCYQLLESGEYNVSEAAMLTGFNQMAHFRETFKKEFGILPSEVKKKT